MGASAARLPTASAVRAFNPPLNPPLLGRGGQKGGAPATIQRVMPSATARQISATHHLPGRIGAVPGDRARPRPVIIGLVRCLAAQAVEEDRRDVQDDEREHDIEPQFVDVARLVRRVELTRVASGPM